MNISISKKADYSVSTKNSKLLNALKNLAPLGAKDYLVVEYQLSLLISRLSRFHAIVTILVIMFTVVAHFLW